MNPLWNAPRKAELLDELIREVAAILLQDVVSQPRSLRKNDRTWRKKRPNMAGKTTEHVHADSKAAKKKTTHWR